MSNNFLQPAVGELTSGTADISVRNVSISSLDVSRPVRSDASKRLVSGNIFVSEVIGLEPELSQKNFINYLPQSNNQPPTPTQGISLFCNDANPNVLQQKDVNGVVSDIGGGGSGGDATAVQLPLQIPSTVPAADDGFVRLFGSSASGTSTAVQAKLSDDTILFLSSDQPVSINSDPTFNILSANDVRTPQVQPLTSSNQTSTLGHFNMDGAEAHIKVGLMHGVESDRFLNFGKSWTFMCHVISSRNDNSGQKRVLLRRGDNCIWFNQGNSNHGFYFAAGTRLVHNPGANNGISYSRGSNVWAEIQDDSKLTISYNSTTRKLELYFDSTKKATLTLSQAELTNGTFSGNPELFVGDSYNENQSYGYYQNFDGRLDNILILNDSVSPTEVTEFSSNDDFASHSYYGKVVSYYKLDTDPPEDFLNNSTVSFEEAPPGAGWSEDIFDSHLYVDGIESHIEISLPAPDHTLCFNHSWSIGMDLELSNHLSGARRCIARRGQNSLHFSQGSGNYGFYFSVVNGEYPHSSGITHSRGQNTWFVPAASSKHLFTFDHETRKIRWYCDNMLKAEITLTAAEISQGTLDLTSQPKLYIGDAIENTIYAANQNLQAEVDDLVIFDDALVHSSPEISGFFLDSNYTDGDAGHHHIISHYKLDRQGNYPELTDDRGYSTAIHKDPVSVSQAFVDNSRNLKAVGTLTLRASELQIGEGSVNQSIVLPVVGTQLILGQDNAPQRIRNGFFEQLRINGAFTCGAITPRGAGFGFGAPTDPDPPNPPYIAPFTNDYDLGFNPNDSPGENAWNRIFVNLTGTDTIESLDRTSAINLSNDIVSTTPSTTNLGSATNRFDTIFCETLDSVNQPPAQIPSALTGIDSITFNPSGTLPQSGVINGETIFVDCNELIPQTDLATNLGSVSNRFGEINSNIVNSTQVNCLGLQTLSIQGSTLGVNILDSLVKSTTNTINIGNDNTGRFDTGFFDEIDINTLTISGSNFAFNIAGAASVNVGGSEVRTVGGSYQLNAINPGTSIIFNSPNVILNGTSGIALNSPTISLSQPTIVNAVGNLSLQPGILEVDSPSQFSVQPQLFSTNPALTGYEGSVRNLLCTTGTNEANEIVIIGSEIDPPGLPVTRTGWTNTLPLTGNDVVPLVFGTMGTVRPDTGAWSPTSDGVYSFCIVALDADFGAGNLQVGIALFKKTSAGNPDPTQDLLLYTNDIRTGTSSVDGQLAFAGSGSFFLQQGVDYYFVYRPANNAIASLVNLAFRVTWTKSC